MGKGFIDDVDDLKVSFKYNENLQQILKNESKVKKQFIRRVNSLKSFFQKYKHESSFKRKFSSLKI